MSARRWAAGVVAALLVGATACGVPVDDKARAIDDQDVPFGLLTPASTAPTTLVPPAARPGGG